MIRASEDAACRRRWGRHFATNNGAGLRRAQQHLNTPRQGKQTVINTVTMMHDLCFRWSIQTFLILFALNLNFRKYNIQWVGSFQPGLHHHHQGDSIDTSHCRCYLLQPPRHLQCHPLSQVAWHQQLLPREPGVCWPSCRVFCDDIQCDSRDPGQVRQISTQMIRFGNT